MKKCIYVFVALLITLPSCKEAPPGPTTTLGDFTPYDRNPMTLKGKIKNLEGRNYWAKEVNGKIEKGEIITRPERDSLNLANDFNIFFYENGCLKKTEYIGLNGQINYWDMLTENARLTKATWYYNGNPGIYWLFNYDDNGILLERERYRNEVDTLLSQQKITYYDNGLRKERFSYNHKGEMLSKAIWTWNDASQITGYQSFDASGNILNSSEIFYDENGNYSEAIFESPNLGIRKFEYKDHAFDEMGNLISIVVYRNDILLSIFELNIEYY